MSKIKAVVLFLQNKFVQCKTYYTHTKPYVHAQPSGMSTKH